MMLACAMALAASSRAQLPNWEVLPVRLAATVSHLFADTTDGYLYMGGSLRDNWQTGYAIVLRYDGTTCDTLPPTPFWIVNVITRYKGKLYIGGQGGVARLDGAQWTRLDSTAYVFGLSHYQGKLIVCGNYSKIGGQTIRSAAFYDGQSFSSLPGLDTVAPGITSVKAFSNAVEYKGELYLGGNINPDNRPLISEIIRFDGMKWTDVGGGIQAGGFAGLWQLFVWGDDLYAIGQFGEGPTSPGKNIARWDGQRWHRLRGGVGDGMTAIMSAVVYNDKLYVGGTFPNVDGMAANDFARWDGGQWCVYPDALTDNIYSFAVYKGNLYASSYCVMTDTFCGRILRWRGIDTVAGCGGRDPAGVSETTSLQKQDYTLSPNPASTTLTIAWSGAPTGPIRYTLTDAAGRTVQTQESSATRHTLPTDTLAPGVYFLRIATPAGQMSTEKVVRQ